LTTGLSGGVCAWDGETSKALNKAATNGRGTTLFGIIGSARLHEAALLCKQFRTE
jgi:hypothetical protein